MASVSLWHHLCCFLEVPDALRSCPAAALAEHEQWFCFQGFPKAGNTEAYVGLTVVQGQHQLSPLRGLGTAADSPKDGTVGLLLLLPIDHAGEQSKGLSTWG